MNADLEKHRCEWRLDEVPTDEAAVALEYEIWREQERRGMNMQGLRAALRFFPKRPWLALDKTQRGKVASRLGTFSGFPAFQSAIGPEGMFARSELATSQGRVHTVVSEDDADHIPEQRAVQIATVAIDWRQPDHDILAAMHRWIQANRPRGIASNRPNRDKPAARLGYLAVLRSVRIIAESDVFEASAALHRRWMAEVGKPLAHNFNIREAWCRAIVKARRLQ